MNKGQSLNDGKGFCDNTVITVKFGGSAVTADNLWKIKEICNEKSRKYCVVSAIGKEYDGDVKVTDLLLALSDEAKVDTKFYKSPLLRRIYQKYENVIRTYRLKLNCEELFEQAFEKYSNTDRAFLSSRGEYLSAVVVADFLGWDFLDSKNVVAFGRNNKLLQKKSIENIAKAVKGKDNIVMSGFYGSFKEKVVTFPRGGSDISGSLLAVASGSDIYENYIDVNGFLICSPKLVGNPQTIPYISYSQMRQMDSLGAECLHRDSVLPLIATKIPLHIRNYHNLHDSGTMVSSTPFCSGLISIVRERLNYYQIKGENLPFKRFFPFIEQEQIFFNYSRQGANFASQKEILSQLCLAFPKAEIVQSEVFYTQLLFGGQRKTEKITSVLHSFGNKILAFNCENNSVSILSTLCLCKELYKTLIN